MIEQDSAEMEWGGMDPYVTTVTRVLEQANIMVCQHPLCWATNRQAARGLLPAMNPSNYNMELEHGFSSSSLGVIDDEVNEDDDDILEGLPTMTILNMLDDYGFDGKDQYPSPSFTSMQDFKATKSGNSPPEGAHITKLTLKSLASHSVDDVTAPANTPLHSAHGFGDYHEYSINHHRKLGSRKQVFTETTVSLAGSERHIRKAGYRRVKLGIDDENSLNLKPKKMLIWCPVPKSRRIKQYLQNESKTPPSLKAVSLPLKSVPEFRNKNARHKAIKGTIPKRTQPAYAAARKMKAVRDAATVSQPRGSSGATPQEIAQLRKVPSDVLIRVLHQAEENGIITRGQTNFLLAQVVGKKDKLPTIKETPKQKVDKATQNEDHFPKTPLETKNIKILNAEDARLHSPRTVSIEPVYKLDQKTIITKQSTTSKTIPPATCTTDFEKPYVPSLDIKEQDRASIQTEKDDEDDNDSQYDVKLRDFAEENLRNIGSFSREIRSPKKTPVRYVATVFDQSLTPTSPIKPFHYPKSPRDIFLGPIPTPPPPTPPTERDSSYDAQIGGSTMLVNLSSTGPSTIVSYKQPSSRSDSKTPTTGRDADARIAKTTQTSMANSQNLWHQTSFESNNVSGGWPQINEEDFLMTGRSAELTESPLPSFAEEEGRALSRNESVVSGREGTPLSEKLQNLQQGEIHSPAPPPPSPEPMVTAQRPLTEGGSSGTTRVGGAATALGLVTLSKNSTQSSPETGGGLTPTPVVSSVNSGVETPLGRVTRPQTLGSTPAIPETPYENDSDDESTEPKPSNDETKEDPNSLEKDNTADDFETNVSPEVMKEELESEMKKLDIG